MTVKDENYYTVFGWMRNRLHLEGNDLKIYAVIYSFSQDGESEYKGNLEYLAEFSGASEKTVSRRLKWLESIGYIEKTDRNTAEGKSNTYKAVSLDIVFARLAGEGQNVHPPADKMSGGGGQNVCPPEGQNVHPFLDNNNINIDSDNNSYIEKESKKVSRKEGSYKPSAGARESYDDLIAKYDLSDEVRASVVEFIGYRILNNRTPTNTVLERTLEALITYPEDKRCKALQDVIDSGSYVLKPLQEKHYEFAWQHNVDGDYQHIMEVFLKDYLGDNADMVFKEIWAFIQHCAANRQKMTNDRLTRLCLKLKKLYRTTEAGKMITALKKAIDGGYYDIKDGEGWSAFDVAMLKAAGNEKAFFYEDDEEEGVG